MIWLTFPPNKLRIFLKKKRHQSKKEKHYEIWNVLKFYTYLEIKERRINGFLHDYKRPFSRFEHE